MMLQNPLAHEWQMQSSVWAGRLLFRIYDLEFRVLGLRFWGYGLELGVYRRFRVLGFREGLQGLGVESLGLAVFRFCIYVGCGVLGCLGFEAEY